MKDEKYFYVGTEDEMKLITRTIDFGDDGLLANKYNVLIPSYKKIVIDVLANLMNNLDFFGYNFRKILEAYKTATPSVAQYRFSYMINNIYDNRENEKGRADYDINNQLDSVKQTIFLKEGTDIWAYIEAICDSLLIDIDLLNKGTGKIYSFKNGWFEKYINDEVFHKWADQNIKKTWNSKLRIEWYEKSLVEQGKLQEGESILEEKTAVMVYSGAYLALMKKSKKNEANAIKCLINSLYAQQLLDGKMPFSYIDAE